jgi:hypothetical protein
MTRYFKIVYERVDTREVMIETEDKSADEDVVTEMFWENFEKYDDESDDHDNDSGASAILTIDEVDENGDEI